MLGAIPSWAQRLQVPAIMTSTILLLLYGSSNIPEPYKRSRTPPEQLWDPPTHTGTPVAGGKAVAGGHAVPAEPGGLLP